MAINSYRPKALFCENQEDKKAWDQLCNNRTLHRAISATQAEMACAGFSSEEQHGATSFVLMLLNLTTEQKAANPLPMRRLTSYDEPAPPPPKFEQSK